MSKKEVDVQAIMALDNTITSVDALPGYRIHIRYTDDADYILDFSDKINRGVMVILKDPLVFAQVAIGFDGRSIEFPGEIDFCADALRVDGEMQKAK